MRSCFRFLVQTWTESAMYSEDFHAKAENACKYRFIFHILDQFSSSSKFQTFKIISGVIQPTTMTRAYCQSFSNVVIF